MRTSQGLVLKRILALTAILASAALLPACSALDYKTGTQVTPQQLSQFQKGKTTQQQVINAIGYPAEKHELMGKEIWTYPFNKIAGMPFAPNISENTTFEWSTKGVLLDFYKSGGSPGKSGNPLLNAAGI